MIATLLLAAALLDFGPERELVPRPGTTLAPRARERARVAAGDQGSLVVWSDGRTGQWNVYGARLDRGGALLDGQGFPIASGIAGDVVWTGSEYLVAYSAHPILYVRRVTPEGVLGEPIPIADTEWVQAHTVRLATDGSTILLMTNSGRGAVLALDGRKLRELNLGVLERAEFSLDIAVANDGYGLAMVTPEGIVFRRIRAEGDEPAQLLPGTRGATSVGLGSDGTSFLAVFDLDNGLTKRLRAQRVGDPTIRSLTDFAAAYPKVVWRGSEYVITFTRTANIDAMAVRASATGEPLGEPVMFATATRPSAPDADRRPDGTGVAAWVSGSRVEAGAFDAADAAPSDVAPISFSAPEQHNVRVATRGTDVFTMYREAGEVRLARGIGGSAVTVSAGDAWPLEVLVDGDVVWAVWNEYPKGIHVRRYTPALMPIDAEPLWAALFENSPLARRTRAAAGGGTLLLVADGAEAEKGVSVRILREVNGALTLDPLFLPTTFLSRNPVAAWNGSEFAIAWAYSQADWIWWMPPVPEHLVVQRVGADGTFLGTPVTIDSTPDRLIRAVEIARRGDDAVLVWQSAPLGTPLVRETFAARVGAPERHAIDNPLRRDLRDVTALGDELLLFWTHTDTESVLLAPDLGEIQRGAVPVPPDDFDLTSAGTRPVLAYARIAEEHGRVFRAFVRATLPPKTRSVRR